MFLLHPSLTSWLPGPSSPLKVEHHSVLLKLMPWTYSIQTLIGGGTPLMLSTDSWLHPGLTPGRARGVRSGGIQPWLPARQVPDPLYYHSGPSMGEFKREKWSNSPRNAVNTVNPAFLKIRPCSRMGPREKRSKRSQRPGNSHDKQLNEVESSP